MDAPNNNEEKLNNANTEGGAGGSEESSGKKKNIIRIFHPQNASEPGRTRKKGEAQRKSRTHAASTSASASQAREAAPKAGEATAAKAAAAKAAAQKPAEAPKAEAVKSEAPKAEAVKSEAPKQEAAKSAPKQGAEKPQEKAQSQNQGQGQSQERNASRQGQSRQGGDRQGGDRQGGERQGGDRQGGSRQGRQGGSFGQGRQGDGTRSESGRGDGSRGPRRDGNRGGYSQQGGERQGGDRQGGDRQGGGRSYQGQKSTDGRDNRDNRGRGDANRGPRSGDGQRAPRMGESTGRTQRTPGGSGGNRGQGQGGMVPRGTGDSRGGQGRFGGGNRSQGQGGTGQRRDNSPASFVGETAKPNKDSRRERDRENKNHKKDYDKTQQGGQGGRRQGQGQGKNSLKPVAKPVKPAPVKKEEKKPEIKEITIPETLTIRELAEAMKVQPSVIVKKLFMKGEMVTVNAEIDFEKAQEIALEFDIIAEKEVQVDVIEELLKEEEEDESMMTPRPPVVCVMGHVDHGKTSLLDYIRNSHVTKGEAGGITQHIGAYVVDINGQKITFLDTPGHEAFTAMRMRGANATDIAVLVVAADDGVMPQTVEAISHAKAAGVEIIVAINKIDKAGANLDRVKQELSEHQLIPEDWGGSTPCVPVSAHTGEGIDELLEMIVLTAEVAELKANPKRAARGLVIEAKLDKGKGPVATILVQKGTLHQGDFIAAGSCSGKVRAMMDDAGNRLKEATPSTPVEILGLSDVPNAGEVLMAFDNDKDAKSFASTFVAENKKHLLEETKGKLSLDNLFSQIQASDLKELPLIVKADVQGSVEAVRQSLEKLSNDEVVVKVIHGGVGAINESDVSLAATSNAIIIGFNVRPDNTAKQLAEQEGVDLRLYKVIYQAIEDVESAMKGMLDPVYEEKVIGHAQVRQLFKASGVGTIAGSYVLDGTFQRGCKVRITREGEQIFEGDLASLKRFKDDVKEVRAGYECGLVFADFHDEKEDDLIEAYIMVEVPR